MHAKHGSLLMDLPEERLERILQDLTLTELLEVKQICTTLSSRASCKFVLRSINSVTFTGDLNFLI